MVKRSIGELMQELFDARLLTYGQVVQLADSCGSVYDQSPLPGAEGWENPMEAPAPHVKFTSYWQFTDLSYMHQLDEGPAIVGRPPNGHIHLAFDGTPEELADNAATVIHILQRIKNGEAAESLVPKLPV